jgi:hypothetical protein
MIKPRVGQTYWYGRFALIGVFTELQVDFSEAVKVRVLKVTNDEVTYCDKDCEDEYDYFVESKWRFCRDAKTRKSQVVASLYNTINEAFSIWNKRVKL